MSRPPVITSYSIHYTKLYDQEEHGHVWIDAWKAAQDPWFNFTSGNGFYSTDKYWIDHLDIPMGYLRDYVVRAMAGEEIERPTAKLIAERDRITAEYQAMMDPEAVEAFQGKLGSYNFV